MARKLVKDKEEETREGAAKKGTRFAKSKTKDKIKSQSRIPASDKKQKIYT
jgi:hypothetical protein